MGAVVLACAISSQSEAQTPVDVELVLAVDVSGSMDMAEQDVQRAGYVEALLHPDVLRAIETGIYGRVAITYVEWGGPFSQSVMVPWTIVDDAGSARAMAARLAEAPRSRVRGTSISGALTFTAGLFHDNGYEGIRQIVDISGDGPNNLGDPVEPARDAVLEKGIVINGLPIMLRPSLRGYLDIPSLDIYYADCVIGGPASFVLPVDDPTQLFEAIRQKLVLEIAGAPPRVILAQAEKRAPRVDCLIGEKLRRSWSDP